MYFADLSGINVSVTFSLVDLETLYVPTDITHCFFLPDTCELVKQKLNVEKILEGRNPRPQLVRILLLSKS